MVTALKQLNFIQYLLPQVSDTWLLFDDSVMNIQFVCFQFLYFYDQGSIEDTSSVVAIKICYFFQGIVILF